LTYGITAGNPAAADVITGVTSGATCVLTSGTADFVGIIWEGHCQNQELSDAGVIVAFLGSTNSTTAYKHLTAAPGASFRDHANVLTNPLRYNASAGAALLSTGNGTSVITVSEANVRISNLQVKASGVGSRAFGSGGGTTGVFIDNCILEGTYTAASSVNGTLSIGSNNTFRNCVVIQRGSGASHIIQTQTQSPFFYNCTIAAPLDLGIPPVSLFSSGASGTVTVQNCGLFLGDSTRSLSAGSATMNYTTCVSDIKGSTGVTQATYGGEFADIRKDSTDLRLQSSSLQINTGTTDAVNASTDIKGTARPQSSAYDVGAWESTYSTPTAISLGTTRRMRHQRATDSKRKRH
jgi:hypothetical protein